MKIAQLALIGVAVVAAGGAYVMANNLLSREPEVVTVEKAAPKIELEEVLIATRNISLGTSMREEMVEWQKWPKEGLAEGYITKSNAPDGLNLEEDPAIARSQFFIGEPIRESKLVRAGKGYMSAILPTGQQGCRDFDFNRDQCGRIHSSK